MKEIYGMADNRIAKKKVDVIRHGPSGDWVGKIKMWWDEDGSYYYGYKNSNRQAGDWQAGDTIRSKKCAETGKCPIR